MTELGTEQRLAAMKADLIAAARHIAEEWERLQRPVGESQFRTLVRLCQEADIPAEIDLYLDYQRGRRIEHGQKWKDLATPVKAELERIRAAAADADPREHLALYAFFFGYVAWAVKGAASAGAGGAPSERRRGGEIRATRA